MSNTSIGASYKKWDKWADMLDDEDPKPKHSGKIDPKDLTVSFGKPLSEEEFRAYQNRKKMGSERKK